MEYTLAACCACKVLDLCNKYVCAIQQHVASEVTCAQLCVINSDIFYAMCCMTGVSPSLHQVMGQGTWLSNAAMCHSHDSMPVCVNQGLQLSLDDLFAASPFCLASPPLLRPSSLLCPYLFWLLATYSVDNQKLQQEALYVFTLSESPAITCRSLVTHVHDVGIGNVFQGPPPPHPPPRPPGHTSLAKLPFSPTVKGA